MQDVVAIDPPDCGCTDCIIGEAIPLDRATNEQIQAMTAGDLDDRTGGTWTLTRKFEFSYHGLVHRTWTE